MPRDVGAHQLDVVLLQAGQPRPVVLERPLAGGRVVGHHLGEQVRVVADLALDPAREQLAGDLVAGADREPAAVVVRGIDARVLDREPGPRIEGQEAEPPRVERQVPHRPPLPVGHGEVVVGIREHPLRGALEHRELLDLVGDGRRDLEAARARPHEGEALAAVVDRVVPARGVERRAGEVVHAGDVGELGPVQRAHRADDEARVERLGRAVGVAHEDRPPPGRLVVGRVGDLGLEADVRTQRVVVQHPDEVLLQLRLLREVLGPVVGGLERVAVEVAADVDARTGVTVLVPRAARPGVLLHDRERQPRLLEADPREQPRFAATDDHHGRVGLHRVGDGGTPGDRAGVGAVEVEVVDEHRLHRAVDLRAGEVAHHLVEHFGRRRRRQDAPGVAIGRDRRQRTPARLRLGILVEVALELVEEQAGRLDVAPDPLGVAGHVDHRAHEGRDAHVLERRGDGRVVIGERPSGVRVAHLGHGLRLTDGPPRVPVGPADPRGGRGSPSSPSGWRR